MAIVDKDILKALEAVRDPETGMSLPKAGVVQNIKIGAGNVSFDIVTGMPSGTDRDQLRAACVAAVREIKGVIHASVNFTAQARRPPQQQGQRKILEGVKNILAVASGKGGVGKSTTAVNIAVALSKMGHKVGVLDADIYGPSIPTMMSISKPPEQGEGNRVIPAEGCGVKIMSMAFFMPKDRAAILRGPMVSGYVSQFMANCDWGALDYLVIDYPPGTGDIQLTLSQQCPITGAVVVTTPQEISLVDVRRAVAMFETTRVPVLGVAETMSYFICDQCDKKHFIFRSGGGERMAAHAGVPFLGGVPIDPRVTQGGDEGDPIIMSHPDSPAAKAYTAIAQDVVDQVALLNMEQGTYLESFSLQWM